MRLILVNFRGRRHLDVTFEEWGAEHGASVFHYIDGASGAGKSTLFEAIYWCLFGAAKAYPWKNKKAKTSVTLHYNNLIVKRSRNPTGLSVTVDGENYDNIRAQQQIHTHLGTSEMWLATTYMRQGKNHPIFEYTPAQRMKLLNTLSFGEEDPTRILTRFDLKIKETEMALKLAKAKYSACLERYNETLAQDTEIDAAYTLDESTSHQYEKRIAKYDVLLRQLKKQRDAAIDREARRSCYQEMETKLLGELETLPLIDDDAFQTLRAAKEQYDNYVRNQDKLKRHKVNLDKLKFTSPPPAFTQDDLTKAIATHRLRSEMEIRAMQLGVKYEADTLKSETRDLETSIEYQPLFAVRDAYEEDQEECERLESLIDDDVPSSHTLEDQIRTMKLSRDIMVCPQCETGLKCIDGLLKPAEGSPFDAERYNQLKTQLRLALRNEDRRRRLKVIKGRLAKTQPPYIPARARRLANVKAARERLDQLRRISYVDAPNHEPVYIQRCLEWHQLAGEIKTFELESCPQGYDETEYRRLTESRRQHVEIKKRLDDVRLGLSKAPAPLESSEVLTTRIKETRKAKAELELALKRNSVTTVALARHKELTRLHAQVNQLHDVHVNLVEMKLEAVDIQRQKLYGLVDSINAYLRHNTCLLFDISIQFSITLTKTIKATGQEKTIASVSITCDGEEVMGLSGGEMTRANLLIASAINHVCGGRLLILDECLSSLSLDQKDIVLDMFRTKLPHCVVLVTNHGLPPGMFDYHMFVERD